MEDIYPTQGIGEAKSVESPSILDSMTRKKLRLEQQLKDVNSCIEALNKNPEINKLLELIAKAR